MDPIAGLAAGAESIKKLSSAIEALKSIQKWIFVQPKEAAAELSRVITELMKATPAVTKATDKLLDVFDNAKPSLSVLAGVGDGSLSHEIEIIRPHCHDISRIANDYLWQWLHTPGVSGAGADSLRAFLMEIRVADDDYLNGLVKFAEAIENSSTRSIQPVSARQEGRRARAHWQSGSHIV